jgi:MFS family permease
VILGFLTFLAPSLENEGFSPAVAGIVVGLYGVAVLCWTRAVKLLSNRLGAAALILIGGGMLALGYAWSAAGHSLVGVGIAAVLVGGGFAFMHSTLQTWATEVVSEARATVISLFAAALFAGSGVATTVAAPLAEAGRFGLLFTTAAVVAVPLGLLQPWRAGATLGLGRKGLVRAPSVPPVCRVRPLVMRPRHLAQSPSRASPSSHYGYLTAFCVTVVDGRGRHRHERHDRHAGEETLTYAVFSKMGTAKMQ